jgi:hypothetical protein
MTESAMEAMVQQEASDLTDADADPRDKIVFCRRGYLS